jgi:hypothetical protein
MYTKRINPWQVLLQKLEYEMDLDMVHSSMLCGADLQQ